MDRLTAAEVFITIVERGSMIGAADTLGMSRSMVTRYLSQMEDWAGTRLLHRSTRSLSLTAAGEKALQQCRQLREISREVSSGLSDSQEQPRGRLRISGPQFIGQLILPSLQTYLQRYPEVSVDLQVRNEMVHLVEERIDLAIRVSNELDPNIIARPLGRCDSVICASPDYLQQQGTPSRPEQLSEHNCLLYANFDKTVWSLTRDRETLAIPVSGNLSSNDTSVLLNAIRNDGGIAMLPKACVAADLGSGRLVTLLPDCQPVTLGIHGIYRSRTHMSQALRLLIDQLVTDFDEMTM